MSTPDQPVKADQNKIHIGDVVTQRRLEEVAVNITKEEFLTLCEGDTTATKTAEAKAKRDRFSSLCWTAIFASVALIASMPGDKAEPWRQNTAYGCVVLALLASAAFGTAWLIFRRSAGEKSETSHYRRTREKLESDFERCEASNQPEKAGAETGT